MGVAGHVNDNSYDDGAWHLCFLLLVLLMGYFLQTSTTYDGFAFESCVFLRILRLFQGSRPASSLPKPSTPKALHPNEPGSLLQRLGA